MQNQTKESFDTFKQKLEQADIYKCTFDAEYFSNDWYQSDADQILDKTSEHAQVLWQQGEGNQIYGNERLYSEGETADTTYVYGLNDSVYAYITEIEGNQYIQKNTYDDYGEMTGIGNGYGYNGEFRDESELIYLRARYYNPKIARFIQIDSFKGDMESIQSQNRYVYVENNPYKYTDPSGHDNVEGFYIPGTSGKKLNLAEKLKYNADKLKNELARAVNDPTYGMSPIEYISYVAAHTEEYMAAMHKINAVAPPPPPPCPEPDWGVSALDGIQTLLDWAGFIGGLGDAADILNAVIYFARGMPIEAIISLACVVFTMYADTILKPLKWAAKSTAELAEKILNALPGVDIIGGLKGALSSAWNKVASLKWVPQSVKNSVSNFITSFKSSIDNIFGNAIEKEIIEETEENLRRKVLEYLKSAIANGVIKNGNNITFYVDENTLINFRRDVGSYSHGIGNHFNIQVMTKRNNGKFKERLNLHIFVDIDSNGKFTKITKVSF